MSKKEFSFNAEQVTFMLQEAVKRVKSEEDPLEMNELKKIFKQNVPLTLRSYVAAYLAKQISGGYRGYQRRDRNPRHSRYQDSSYRNTGIPSENHTGEMTPRVPAPRAQIAEEYAQTVFVSVGRNRHVFARELIGLFSTVGKVERERIGDIRVCDNYSFVTLFAEDADNAIQLLDGIEYRGRKLSVSYSRRKEGYSGAAPIESQEDAVETEAAESAGFSNEETTENED